MKRITIGVLVLCFLLAFALPAQALTVEELLEAAEANLADAKSYEMDMVANLQLSDPASAQSIALNMTIDGAFILEPLMAKLSAAFGIETSGIEDADLGLVLGTPLKFNMYMQTEDDVLVMYIDDGESAIRLETLNINDLLSQIAGLEPLVSLQDLPYTNYVYHGIEKLNKRNVYVVEAQIDVAFLEEVMMSQIPEEALAALSRAERRELEKQLKAVLDSLKEMKLKFYVDCNAQTYSRMEIDMTSFVKGMLSTMGAGEDINIDAVTFSCDYKNYNKVRKFSIPRSVIKRAEENTVALEDSMVPFLPSFQDAPAA